MKHVLLTTLTCFALIAGQLAQAALVNPTGVTLNASSEFFPVGNLVDNSGLSGVVTDMNFASITHANASATTAWVTDDPAPGGGDYYAEDPPNPIPSLTFSLDQTYNLTHVLTWGYHFGATNGNEAKSITVEFSTDGGASFPTSTDITRTFSAAATDTQSLGGEFMANAVRFLITDNFFEDAGGGDRVGLGEVKFLSDVTGFFGVQINRDTGVMTVNNDSAFTTVISGIDITSGQGLEAANWNSIAENYDADSGGSVDPTNTWLEFIATTDNLAEGTLGNTSLGSGSSVDLGAIWQKSPVEDVQIDFLLEDGTLFSPPVEYVGNGGNAFEVGDLNFDGSITTADWPIFRDGYREDLPALTPAGDYQMGDLNGDGVNNVTDFGIFEVAFDQANGPGSFQAMLASVPEPTSLLLLAMGSIFALGRQRRSVGGNMSNKMLLVLVMAGLVLSAGSFCQPTQAALLGHYEFEDAGNLGLDSAGGDNNGTALSDDVSAATGRVGAGALAIDGTGIGLELANPETFQPLTTFTIASFISPDFDDPNYGNGSAVGRVFGSLGIDADGNQFGTNSGYGFGAISNGQLRYTTYGVQDYNQDAGVVSNEWQHIATVVVNGDATFYLNGNNVGTITGNNPTATENPFHIGASAFFNSDRFIGLIDDLRVYDEALDDAEISALANVGQPSMTLQVNTTTGSTTLLNNSGVNFDVNLYEITSPGGALNATGWNSLTDQDFEGSGAPNGTGDGWEELGTPDSEFLGEAFLQGSTVIADQDTIDLGFAFNTSVFGAEQDGDLVFNYRTTSGTVLNGQVEYVTGDSIFGDFEPDGDVDIIDFGVFADAFGSTGGDGNYNPAADSEPDSDVDIIDFGKFADNFGIGTLQSAAVPEPTSVALAAIGLVGLLLTCRQRLEN